MSDDSIKIETSADGKSFTVSDNIRDLEQLQARAEALTDTQIAAYGPMSTGDKALVTVFFAAIVAGVGAIGWFAVKQEQAAQAEIKAQQEERRRKREERDAWIEEQRNSGRVIIETVDGEYIAISVEEFAKAPVRHKAK